FFKSEEDLNSVCAQMHSFMKNVGNAENMHVKMGMIYDMTTSVTFADMKQLLPSAIVNNIGTKWQTHYDVIHFANLILDNIHRVENLPEDRKNFYLGQAYFAKGFMYFNLARDWGNAVITKNSESQAMLGNSTDREVLAEAIRNAELAEKLLDRFEDLVDLNGSALPTKQYGSKGAAAALLAHAYAWKGSMIDLYGWEDDARAAYEKSIEWASVLIEGKAGNYSLETVEGLCQNSLSGYGVENIFSLAFDEYASSFPMTVSLARFLTNWPVNTTVTPSAVKTKTFAVKASRIQAMYELQDERRNSFFYKLDEMANEDEAITGGFAYVYKWREGYYKTNTSGSVNMISVKADDVIWRLADIYLLRAECYAKLGDTRAKDDLNEIRRRAKATEYPASGENDIRMAIFREREKELIYEGHRYYDAVRNNYLTELDPAYGELTEQDIQDGVLYLPIYEGAFTMNDILRQNKYWFKFQ
ncbi:RagB/SusD family nutrient uptake outer membrane protein, partial [Parabacteroides johnsonii]|uniref:RagB/SusD family nutrient uptake outer membrane protein n=1 Tax=Parabacteroides johnsonii TaxID=387661 RepID=UPI00307F930A